MDEKRDIMQGQEAAKAVSVFPAQQAEGTEQGATLVMPGTNELVAAEDIEDIVESNVIRLNKPYMFEGQEYNEIDLSGMDDMTTRDMLKIEKLYNRANGGASVMPEVSEEYALFFAATVTKLPVEFFYGLPAKMAIRIKNRVMGFLFGSD